jgi:hypothetical protein
VSGPSASPQAFFTSGSNSGVVPIWSEIRSTRLNWDSSL